MPAFRLVADARPPEVRDVRRLVHLAADAVPAVFLDDPVALALAPGADRGGHVAEVVPRPRLLDARPERRLGHAQQLCGLRRDLAHRRR